jgi:hypothetical protein
MLVLDAREAARPSHSDQLPHGRSRAQFERVGADMADGNAREKLLDLLDRKAFDPVINASPDKVADEKRKKLEGLKETTRSTKKSYHEKYGSAEKVVEMFRDDLSSDSARKVQRELKSMGLPTLQDVEDEFEKLAGELEV